MAGFYVGYTITYYIYDLDNRLKTVELTSS